jgi:hypothetical protein
VSNKVFDSANFVALDTLPEIDDTTSVADAYRLLGGAGRAAFSYAQGGQRFIVKANELLNRLYGGADISTIRQRTYWSMGDAMRRLNMPTVKVAIEAQGVSAEEEAQPLLDQGAKQAFLVTEGDRSLGWLFNDDALLEVATKRLVYICGNSHENPDPDHGTCYQCPAKIVRSELR